MKNKILNFCKSIGALLLLLVTMLLQLSFTVSQYIEIPPNPDAGMGTSASIVYKIEGKIYNNISSEKIRIYDIDECDIAFHLPGIYDLPFKKHYPQKDIQFNFKYVEYILPKEVRISTRKKQKEYLFKVMGVSAPQWVSAGGISSSYALDSRTPFSLQNALRLAVQSSQDNNNVWSKSNWANSNNLQESVFLMNYFEEEKDIFIKRICDIQPQILFIGSMTLSFPGAIELAQLAKQELGNEVFIVLGGKHPIETVYWKNNQVNHHPGSPVMLMESGSIPKVFDLVVSGDGEDVVKTIGESLGKHIINQENVLSFSNYINEFETTKGNFILSWVEEGNIKTFVKQNNPLDYEQLPSPVSLFGVNNSFAVFNRKYTAHVYSDMGKGCVFNCFFCSERSGINGSVIQTRSPAKRLYNQLRDASLQSDSMSAFVEDAILLMGLPKHLHEFSVLLEENPLPIVFGGQFTVDNLLDPKVQPYIQKLSKLGLVYIFTGMETLNEEVATSMSKNTKRKESWIERNEQAVAFVTRLGIKHGVSILWGLGESSIDRTNQLSIVEDFQKRYGNPVVVSPNWATQHPLFNQSVFNYVDWGTDKDSKYLKYFTQLFGEASERYCLDGIKLPETDELEFLILKFQQLNIENV